jgi:hypothetical protein
MQQTHMTHLGTIWQLQQQQQQQQQQQWQQQQRQQLTRPMDALTTASAVMQVSQSLTCSMVPP